MKNFIPILILFATVIGLCVWDSIYTNKIFNHMLSESKEIYETCLSTDITDENLKASINNLNSYWTEKMDILCISISRKDLQIVSDYLQYLYSATINKNQEDAVTYSRLLNYNLVGLTQSTGIKAINLL